MKLKVKNDQVIEILSLSLIQQKSGKEDLSEVKETFNQVYLKINSRKGEKCFTCYRKNDKGEACPVQIKKISLGQQGCGDIGRKTEIKYTL